MLRVTWYSKSEWLKLFDFLHICFRNEYWNETLWCNPLALSSKQIYKRRCSILPCSIGLREQNIFNDGMPKMDTKSKRWHRYQCNYLWTTSTTVNEHRKVIFLAGGLFYRLGGHRSVVFLFFVLFCFFISAASLYM
jgi:hypothetical protein